MLVVPLDQVLPGNRGLVLCNAVAAEVVNTGSSKVGVSGCCCWRSGDHVDAEVNGTEKPPIFHSA